jgi:uncharacterized repeat protein (TIGR01451 family)
MRSVLQVPNPVCKWALRALRPICIILFLATLLIPFKINAQTGKTFTVNTIGDAADPNAGETGDDGICDTDPNTPGEQCTFRAAIQNHNGNRQLDLNHIVFAITDAPPGTDAIVINVGSTGLGPLPPVLGAVTIEGLSSGRRIELNGSQAGGSAIGLQLLGGKCVITFLVINSFSSHGVFIAGTPPPGEGGHLLESNFIGTDETGTIDRGNGGDGIFIENTPNSKIGGKGVLGNVIAANKGWGIHIAGRDPSQTGQPNGAFGNILEGNMIGQDFGQTVLLPNLLGGVLDESAPQTRIGGPEPGQGNNIVGVENGIRVEGSLAKGVEIIGNFIGKDGTGARFRAGITTRAGEQLVVQGNILTNIDSVGLDIYLDANGAYNIRDNDMKGKVKVGAKLTFGPGRTIDVNYLNNLSIGNDLGLHIEESLNSTINWQIVGDTAKEGQTGANVIFKAAGKKDLQSNRWEANAGIGFKYLYDFSPGVQATITINGDVYLKNGEEGSSGRIQLQSQADLQYRILKISGNENGKDGMSLALAAFGGAKADIFLGEESDLSLNVGAALRLLGEKSSIDLFKVSLENLDAHSNKDRDAVFYLFDVKLGGNSFTNSSITGNTGTAIVLEGSSSARIDSNTIAHNGGAIVLRDQATATIGRNTINDNGTGVLLATSGTGIVLSANRIFNNQGPGIDLGSDGVTPNDAGDADSGPNNLQNYPVLTSMSSAAGNTTIQGTLNSTPNTTFKLEFFSNTTCNPTGFGEGETFLGSDQVTTGANGNVAFAVQLPGITLPAGAVVTATATDPNNNTSEFSKCLGGAVLQGADLELVHTADSLELSLGNMVTFTVRLINKGPSAATGIEVTDLLPLDFLINEVTTTTGTYNSTTGKWQVPGLSSGSEAVLTIQATATQEGNYIITAEVTASGITDPDSSPGNAVETEDDQKDVILLVRGDITIDVRFIQLRTQVNALVASGDLSRQQANLLNAILGASLNFYRNGNIRAAIGGMQVFIGVVRIFVNFSFFGRLPAEKGQLLITSASGIITALRALEQMPVVQSPIMGTDMGDIPAEAEMRAAELAGFRLHQNYPNPFRNTTVITFEIPVQHRVGLSVTDVNGRTVATLVDAVMPAGKHNITWQAGHLPAGMYILRMDVGHIKSTVKMMRAE